MIWVIAGTVDARKLIGLLVGDNYPVTATTTTGYGRDLIGEQPGLTVLAGPLDRDGMEAFIRERGISVIVDASHPYAAEVSRSAIAVAGRFALPYIRLERPPMEQKGAVVVATYEEAALRLEKPAGNIMLTIGTKNLASFARITGAIVYARVLSTAESIAACERHGFRPEQIIAARFPFSKDFNRALFRELGIRHLVSKESGSSGGAPEKFAAAAELGIETIVIGRPRIDYPEVLFDPREVMRRIGEIVKTDLTWNSSRTNRKTPHPPEGA